jgi:hypothetical protein
MLLAQRLGRGGLVFETERAERALGELERLGDGLLGCRPVLDELATALKSRPIR